MVKTWTNPPARLPFPKGFPASSTLESPAEDIVENIRLGLKSQGMDFDAVSRIHIAYPHKAITASRHYERTMKHIHAVRDRLEEDYPGISWKMASAITEKQALNRFKNDFNHYALTVHQEFGIKAGDKGRLFLREEKPVFLLMDDVIDAGTTMAELHNYITHNGGVVAAVVAGLSPVEIAQVKARALPGLDRKWGGAIPDLARRMLAKPDAGIQHVNDEMRKLEEALNSRGNSLHALTNNEISKLAEEFEGLENLDQVKECIRLFSVRAEPQLPGLRPD
ncbi:MAG: hypothetical protein JWO78_1221 [Micavibrio sp.]|nr:hypothetical protein [Micavibrio sp.]